VTERDVYPLPRIDDTLDLLGNCTDFTTLDFASGYWQIEMAPKDRPKTALITREGLFEFEVMPFGLCNAPGEFQRLMNTMLSGMTWRDCLVYLDDIIIFTKGFDNHLIAIERIFTKIREAKLKLKGTKCQFAKPELVYLGYTITQTGILPDASKIASVKNFPCPINIKTVKSFIELCSYYSRRYVQNFSVQIDSSPILAYPDFRKPFILFTDASDSGLGTVLSQIQDDKERVISYASRSLQATEKNYSVTERECLAIVWAIEYFHPYLLGKKFEVITDHSALQWFRTIKQPSGRLARWAMKLQHYNFDIKHRSGK